MNYEYTSNASNMLPPPFSQCLAPVFIPKHMDIGSDRTCPVAQFSLKHHVEKM